MTSKKPAAQKPAAKAVVKGKVNAGKKELKVVKEKSTKRTKPVKAVQVAKPKSGYAKKRKIHTSVAFRRPKTLHIRPKIRPPTKSAFSVRNPDKYSIIRRPLTSDKAMKKIEDDNSLVFIVDRRANKVQIKDAIKAAYNIRAVKINTLIRPDGTKKAMIKVSKDDDALDLANKIGIV